MVWMLEIDGLIVDARWLSEPVQVGLCRHGLIPYVPARSAMPQPATPALAWR
jgi:hypothetical protein